MLAVWALVLFAFVTLLRLVWIITHPRLAAKERRRPTETCSLAVFLGSGGHTSEALTLLSSLDFSRYTPRKYIISEGDILSAEKAVALEQLKAADHVSHDDMDPPATYDIIVIPRARRVHQSLLMTPPTALRSLFACIYHMTIAPFERTNYTAPGFADLLILNGPGTCFVLCAAAYLNRFLGRPSPKVIYVESFARVKSLSLSGKLLYPFVDRFIVQWPQLGYKGEYRGWLV